MNSTPIKFDDFIVEKFLQEGGWGRVYSAIRKSDNKRGKQFYFGLTNITLECSCNEMLWLYTKTAHT